ncbi:MAG: hypothetical protein WC428_02805 [Candidatus Paceibacterota bacterium]|jgi:hypothetical protein
MLQLIRKFPFFKIVEVQTPPNFDTVIVNSEELTEIEKQQIKAAKELLSLHQIPLNKVRFIFDFKFTYDVDKNIVNPKYTILVPRKKKKNNHPIEINVPENLMTIAVGVYQTDYDDFENVKNIIKNSKKGVVIKLNHVDHFSKLDSDVLMANLDGAIEFHKNSI